jgi:hypothetical protein
VLRLTIVIGRSPLQNTSHKEGRAHSLSFDERSAKFRPSVSFFSAVSGWQVACIAVCVGWEEVRLPEQVRHTLYQVSTATALVEGVYEGAVQVSTLRKHGDLGLGTFEGLDGEMVIVDGHFYQLRSDGSVREVQDNALSPFAAVTAFSDDQAITLDDCPDLSKYTRMAQSVERRFRASVILNVVRVSLPRSPQWLGMTSGEGAL